MNETFRQDLKDSRFLHRPLKEHPENGGHARWEKKPVLKSLELPFAENPGLLKLDGPASLSLNREITRSGKGSVCVESATTLPVKHPNNRYYYITVLTAPFAGLDLSAYNRISLWVYVDAPCFESLMLQFALINEGEKILPEPGRFVGIHHEQVIPDSWHHVIWEIPELARDKVTGFTIQIPVSGVLPGGDETIRVYAEDLRAELVDAENTHGFTLRKNTIAFCHSGYTSGARKQALVQHCDADVFSLINESGETVFTGPVQPISEEACRGLDTPLSDMYGNPLPADLSGFALLNFSAFRGPARVRISCGALQSGFFPVGDDAFIEAAWKTLNFFYCERCGADIPGTHSECHLDLICRHPDGRTLPAYGGWHDAADLTLGTTGTARHILSMLELAEAVREKETDLYERLIEEVRFGLNFLVRTRFGDGYRFGGSIVGIWTDNIGNDFDDIIVPAEKDPVMNLLAAAACAKALPHFENDRVFTHTLRKCAVMDYGFAEEGLKEQAAEKRTAVDQARISLCALQLYEAFREPRMLELAVSGAHYVAACQECTLQTQFTLPLRGYFYETAEKKRVLNFYHQSSEHELSECFIRLLSAFPGHEDAPLWQECIEAAADYYRTVSDVTAPYGVLPAGLYELDNTDQSGIYHEGAKIGLPTMEEFNAEVQNGIPMTDRIFLRRFPVAYQFRGFNVTVSSKGKAALLLGRYLKDRKLIDAGVRQLEYILGFNPFAMSTVYGEGYDYPPLYSGFLGDTVGAAPVGIETFENEDAPYMPMQINCTYKEIWSHADGYLMELIALTTSMPSGTSY